MPRSLGSPPLPPYTSRDVSPVRRGYQPFTAGHSNPNYPGHDIGHQETSPLILNSDFPAYGSQPGSPPPKPQPLLHKIKTIPIWVWIVIAATCSAGIVASIQTYRVVALNHRLAEYPPTRAELDELKQEWGLELTAHKQMQDYDKWAEDRLAFERERDEWLVARRDYRVDQESWDRQRQLYEEATEDWRGAKQDYERVKKETQQYMEEDAHRFRLSEGNALGLSWTHVESHECVAHGTREYTARITFDAEKACELPIAVNGAVFGTPQECKMDGDSLVSRWSIDRGQASCKTYWGDLVDKGCTGQGSGKHRFEARLWGLPLEFDLRGWPCAQPPLSISAGLFSGMVGMWDVDDKSCS
ncbi:uncharacterized protein B0H18DRAFT_968147 [Fomitopsis serialis]|uniref:uncharacterized protein n=1 Tax=Fomitopsis serialis TaxID=139415 RepID=UPI002007EE56|nr:uncharacterized protein B0H18DRAFT_968147 [Neoantrodia serialis]KAH9938642.1 hypothetical protein B0H18DRAFT_968147 [Neoantrodia serialis]